MIKWLCTLPLLKKIYRQGGIDSFHLASKDIQETLRDDVEAMANKRIGEKLVEMLSPVDWNHVMSSDTRRGFIFIGKTQADAATLQALKQEAEMLASMEIWRLLIESPNALAQQVMFKTGEDPQAFQKGRSMLFHLDSQKKIVETLRAYSQPKPSPTQTGVL